MTSYSNIRPALKIFAAILALTGLFILVRSIEAETDFSQDISQNISKIQGRVESTGVYFGTTDSAYLNITVSSSEPIKLNLESMPEMVRMTIEPASPRSKSQITIGGFVPLTAYYKYEDNYHNLTEFTTDATGTYIYIQDISMPHFIFIQPRKSSKFINNDATGGDCNSIGIWDLSTKTCTLTADVSESIQIDSDNVTLDGNGHAVIGSNTGIGIFLWQRTGVTIRNMKVKQFFGGIELFYSNNNVISNNTVDYNRYGIRLQNSGNNVVTENNIDTAEYGIYLESGLARDNSVNNNRITGGGWGIYVYFGGLRNRLEKNTINLTRLDGIRVLYTPDIKINGNTISNSQYWNGIYIGRRTTGTTFDITISENTIYGSSYGILLDTYPITLDAPEKILVYHNNIYNNKLHGSVSVYPVELSYSSEGNYWGHSEPPCFREGDTNNFTNVRDSYPFCRENGWIISIDTTPPEAKIFFNQETNALAVEGIDDLSKTKVTEQDSTFTVTDEAGNTLKLIFQGLKKHGKEIKAELKNLQYGNDPIINLPNTELKYEWSVDKDGAIKELEQRITVKNQFDIKAKYNHAKDTTEIQLGKESSDKEKSILNGLSIIELVTKRGQLNYNF